MFWLFWQIVGTIVGFALLCVTAAAGAAILGAIFAAFCAYMAAVYASACAVYALLLKLKNSFASIL